MVMHHAGMLGADTRLELPGGLRVHVQSEVNVRGHVPHVADRRGRIAAVIGRVECAALHRREIADVDHRVVDRVIGIHLQDGVGQFDGIVHFGVAGLARFDAEPHPPDFAGLCLLVVRVLGHDGPIAALGGQRIDIHLFAIAQAGLVLGGQFGELAGAGRSVMVGDRGAPPRHAGDRVIQVPPPRGRSARPRRTRSHAAGPRPARRIFGPFRPYG